MPSAGRAIDDTMRFAVVVIAGAALLILIFLRLPRKRRGMRSPPEPAPAPAPAPPRSRSDPLRDAVAAFRVRGDDTSLDALRNLLFARAGAQPGATLTDALHALGARDPALARAMAIAERVRFGPQAGRANAADDLFAALDALLHDPVHAG